MEEKADHRARNPTQIPLREIAVAVRRNDSLSA
jgi:hypothetical protein